MKHSQKAKYILCACMLLVGIFSAVALLKTFRPSGSLPYEVLTMEKAGRYMEYEEGYALIDISEESAYEAGHLKGAENIPYEQLYKSASTLLPDPEQSIYLCGADEQLRAKAAMKLCELRYTNVAVIEGTDAPQEETETA